MHQKLATMTKKLPPEMICARKYIDKKNRAKKQHNMWMEHEVTVHVFHVKTLVLMIRRVRGDGGFFQITYLANHDTSNG